MTKDKQEPPKFKTLDEVIEEMESKHPGFKNRVEGIRKNIRDCPTNYLEIVDGNFWDLIDD